MMTIFNPYRTQTWPLLYSTHAHTQTHPTVGKTTASDIRHGPKKSVQHVQREHVVRFFSVCNAHVWSIVCTMKPKSVFWYRAWVCKYTSRRRWCVEVLERRRRNNNDDNFNDIVKLIKRRNKKKIEILTLSAEYLFLLSVCSLYVIFVLWVTCNIKKIKQVSKWIWIITIIVIRSRHNYEYSYRTEQYLDFLLFPWYGMLDLNDFCKWGYKITMPCTFHQRRKLSTNSLTQIRKDK